MKKRYKLFVSTLPLLFSLSSHAIEIEGNSSGVDLSDLPLSAVSMAVRGPNGFFLESDDFYIDSDTGLSDGKYSFEILGELETVVPTISDGTDGRGVGSVPTQTPIGVVEIGYFRLVAGELLEEIAE